MRAVTAVVLVVVLMGAVSVFAQDLPMDPLSTWQYIRWGGKDDLLHTVVRDRLFAVFAVSDEDSAALLERYDLSVVPVGLQADDPDIHRLLFVELGVKYAGRSVVLEFQGTLPSTPAELLSRVTALSSEEEVLFASPVFERDGNMFALSPYARIAWSDILDIGKLPQALRSVGLTLVRPPMKNEQVALAQLLPKYYNILAAMVKVQEDPYFNADPSVTHPVLVLLTPPLVLEWKVRPAGVEELRAFPRAVSGAPLVLHMWVTLASHVSLPTAQFESGGVFAQNMRIVRREEGKEPVVLDKTPLFAYDHSSVRIGSAVVDTHVNDDGSVEQTIMVPFNIRPTGEYWLDKMSFLVQAINPLTQETTEYSYEAYYDEPITVLAQLDAMASDGGGVSSFSAGQVPATITPLAWPWLLGLLGLSVLALPAVVATRAWWDRYRTPREIVVLPTSQETAIDELTLFLWNHHDTDDVELWERLDAFLPSFMERIDTTALPDALREDIERLMHHARMIAFGGELSDAISHLRWVAVVECLLDVIKEDSNVVL